MLTIFKQLFLLLETVFTIIFHGARPSVSDSLVEHLQLWRRDEVAWDPLCSHLPLVEGIMGGLEKTEDELNAVAVIRRARKAHQSKLSARKFSRNFRANDAEGWRARQRGYQKSWREKDPARYASAQQKENVQTRERRQAAKQQQKFRCNDCDENCASQDKLRKHKKSQAHLDTVNGVVRERSEASIQKSKRKKANRKANEARRTAKDGGPYCATCKKSLASQDSLTRHKKATKHLKALEDYEKQVARTTSECPLRQPAPTYTIQQIHVKWLQHLPSSEAAELTASTGLRTSAPQPGLRDPCDFQHLLLKPHGLAATLSNVT
jgi:hypothetical protein